jgi:biotin operon repressor
MRSLLLKPTNALRGRKNHEMTQFDNDKAMKELCEQLMTLAEDKAKAKLRASLYEAWNDHGRPLVESLPEATAAKPAKPANNWHRMAARHHRLVAELKRGYQSVPVLAGNLECKKQSIYAMLTTLKKNGYTVQIHHLGSRQAGRYMKIYRIPA